MSKMNPPLIPSRARWRLLNQNGPNSVGALPGRDRTPTVMKIEVST